MKKIILSLVIVSALFILKANAQFSVGPKFGLNLAMVTDSTSTGYKGVLNKGVHYGVVFNYQMKEAFSLQTELLYTVKGEKQISGENFQQLNLNYFEIPVLAKYTFGKNKLTGFVEGGPYFAYWMSGVMKYKIVEYQMEGNDKYKFDDIDLGTTVLKDNRFDIGVNVGTGLMYSYWHGNFVLDARFGLGLSSINHYTGDKLPGWINKHNRVVSVSAGYMFNLGK